jgi:hypothetical protein
VKIKTVKAEFGAVIPTANYANVEMHLTWEATLGPNESAEEATEELFTRIRAEVRAVVKPIATAKIRAAQHIINNLPPREREALMSLLGPAQWLAVVEPELDNGRDNG